MKVADLIVDGWADALWRLQLVASMKLLVYIRVWVGMRMAREAVASVTAATGAAYRDVGGVAQLVLGLHTEQLIRRLVVQRQLQASSCSSWSLRELGMRP